MPFHALGLLGAGLIADRLPASRAIVVAGALMAIGTLLFSGNLYLRSLADYHALHAVTPWGGGAFILSWLALVGRRPSRFFYTEEDRERAASSRSPGSRLKATIFTLATPDSKR